MSCLPTTVLKMDICLGKLLSISPPAKLWVMSMNVLFSQCIVMVMYVYKQLKQILQSSCLAYKRCGAHQREHSIQLAVL